MKAIDRKLLRDFWRLRGQAFAVALVVASGVALLVMSLSTLTSLRDTTNAYYDRYGFADVFAGANRVPQHVADRIADLPGVRVVETRVSAFTTVSVTGFEEPVTVRLLSIPEDREPVLNRFALQAGRSVRPGRDDEAVVYAPFANAHGLVLGDDIQVLLNGTRRPVRVVGIARSPEFAYAIAPGGLMPDDHRFGILWMGRRGLEAAYDMKGAFNDVSLSLFRETDPALVITELDATLERYGGAGAIARENHISNWFLMNELDQLRTMSTILPTIFLAVSAFLTNTVLARLIAIERREISLLKAFGYRNRQIGWHYAKLAIAMTFLGIVMGWIGGALLGRFNTRIYADLFEFPFLFFRPNGAEFAISAGTALLAGLFGALWAVRGALALAPAEAMRPPVPERYRLAGLPRLLIDKLDAPTRIILRHIMRTPHRAAVTVLGVALSVAILVTAMQWEAAISELIQGHFSESQRQDVVVGFAEPRGRPAEYALGALPGVMAVEPLRIVAADLSAGRVTHRGGLTALPEDAHLQVIYDVGGWHVPVPASGVVLGSLLAEKLEVGPGDTIEVTVLDRDHPVFEATVAGVHESWIAMPAYISLRDLNRQLGDPPSFDYASLIVDEAARDSLLAALRDLPALSTVTVKQTAIDQMLETIGETILVYTGFFVVFSGMLAYGVVYSAARVALSERGRELATLRVLGFSRWEVSYILIGETALLVLLALPIGCLLGTGLVGLIVQSFETELFRLPFVVPPSAYGEAALVILVASAVSAAVVRRRLDRLDLISVLKTRE